MGIPRRFPLLDMIRWSQIFHLAQKILLLFKMINISGRYRFNTKVGNVPEAVFLYKKLQDTTRPFEYQSESKSWQLHNAPVELSATGRKQLVALELPDNTGDYDSLAKAKEQKRKESKKDVPCIKNDRGDTDTEPGADGRSIIVLWIIRDTDLIKPEFIIAGNCAGYQGITSGSPLGVTDEDYAAIAPEIIKSAYIFFNQPYSLQQELCQGSKPFMSVDKAVFCQNKPWNVIGKVAYRLRVSWKNSAYRPSNTSGDTNGIFYDGYKPSGFSGTGEEFLKDCADDTYIAEIAAEWESTAGNTAVMQSLNSCGDDVLDGWWLYDADLPPGQVIGYREGTPATISQDYGYICWQGSMADYSAWESYMNSMLSYWGILDNGAECTRIGSMAINSQGGSCSLDSTGNPVAGYPPDPNPVALPLIGWAKYHGRYCDIFVNYQKNGVVKELKLPIDFPTRITHIVYEYPSFYDPLLPMESPGQRIENPWFFSLAEWFSGRVNIDKEYIYVDIVYEIIREYESGKKIIPNGILANVTSNPDWGTERPGIISRYNSSSNEQFIGDGKACLLANSDANGQVYARPIRDKFNKTVRYTINKLSFTIVNTEVFEANHPTDKELFSDNFLKHNTILNIAQRHDYVYYNSLNAVPVDTNTAFIPRSVTTPSPDSMGYLGLPTPYFQISTKPFNNYADSNYVFIERLYSDDYYDYTAKFAADFLTLKVDWNDVYWLFYLMMEQPYINRADMAKLIDFKDRCQQGGAGYNKDNNKVYLQYLQEFPGLNNAYDNRKERVSPGFFDLYIEHERLRGYPLIKAGKIKQWFRLKPKSLPLFQQNEPYL